MAKQTTTHDKGKSAKRQLITVLLAFVAVVCVGVTLFVVFFGNYNDRVLYNERLSQMSSVTTELFSSLDNVVENEWDTTAVQVNYLDEENPSTEDELTGFMHNQYRLSGFKDGETDLIAVDDTGHYFTQSGRQGTFVLMQSLLSEPGRISAATNTLTTGQTNMLFLERLERPIKIVTGSGAVKLRYYGLSYNMSNLEPYFMCKAYEESNCVYVVDDNGAKIFSSSSSSSSSSSLIKGHNIFKVLGQMEYLHGSSFDKTMSDLEQNGVAYSNAVLDGEEYYYALYKMDSAEWTMAFLVPAKYVATNTVDLVNSTMRFVMVFALILVVVCSLVIVVVMTSRQRQLLAVERKNSEAISAINSELDHKNEQLTAAIVDAQKARRQAESSSRAKSDFLANMSHDIRTPMNAIVGLTSLMEHEGPGSEHLEDYIHKIKLSSHHLLSLINDILDMSKIESDKVDLQVAPVNLAIQLDQVDNIVRGQAAERRQTFEVHTVGLAHEYLLTDAVRLRQVLLNLLGNAVKYTPEGGSIIFEIAELDCVVEGRARFSFKVSDTGIGMSEDYLPHVFEPFSRAEGSGTNKVQGTGLGMAITKNVVELMGGTISVESVLGEGTTFTVTLSFDIDRDARYNVGVDNLLLVSTEERLIDNISRRCDEAGLTLETCPTVEAACSVLAQGGGVQAVLYEVDVKRAELASEVSSLREAGGEDLLVFIMGYEQREKVAGLVAKAGADDCIARPFFIANLEICVRRAHGHAHADTSSASVLNGMRFLCAEDNDLNIEILGALLKMYGASCEFCTDGVQIVERFKSVHPDEFDAILMDIQMPKMNGCDAAIAIRQGDNPVGASIPIIAMTANAFSEDVQRSLRAGMNAHISKPVDIALLEKEMEKLVG